MSYQGPAFDTLIHACLTCATYVCRRQNYSTSHNLRAWTQEANWPYRGQTHKAVLAVGWWGMHKCMRACVWMCAMVGIGEWGGVWEALPSILLLWKSSHERPCQELQWGLSRPSQRQSRLNDATAHSHSWSQELLQLLLFRTHSEEWDSKTVQMQEDKWGLKGQQKGGFNWSLRIVSGACEAAAGEEMSKTCTRECALMTGVITDKCWMEKGASGGQWQIDFKKTQSKHIRQKADAEWRPLQLKRDLQGPILSLPTGTSLSSCKV